LPIFSQGQGPRWSDNRQSADQSPGSARPHLATSRRQARQLISSREAIGRSPCFLITEIVAASLCEARRWIEQSPPRRPRCEFEPQSIRGIYFSIAREAADPPAYFA